MMKSNTGPSNWEWEKKLKGPKKGSEKIAKHRKGIYNILSDYDEEDYFDEEFDNGTDVKDNLDDDNER